MKNSVLTAFTFAVVSIGAIGTESASGQNAILAEMYGRGVHAYYAGLSDEANQFLTMAIDNGIQDPRAYYFRGMVAETTGQTEQAEADWTTGAEMEASGRTNPSIGRSLTRFQGSARLKLERIRQSARLQAMATSMARSKQRYGEIQASEASVARSAPARSTAAGSAPPVAVTPPPIPSSVENPFADDMAQGKPNVQADDALKDAMNDPFADDGAPAVSAGNSNPFGGGGDAGAGDPFGGGAAGGADPFGGGGDAGGADPFGGGGDAGGADPFGGAADAGADPFGN